MLYALVSYSDQIAPLNVFRFVTFRSGGAFLTALLLVTHFARRANSSTGIAVILASATVLWLNWRVHAWVGLAALLIVGLSSILNASTWLKDRVLTPTMIAAASVGLFAYLSGNAVIAASLHVPNVAGLGELTVACGAVLGAGWGLHLLNQGGSRAQGPG